MKHTPAPMSFPAFMAWLKTIESSNGAHWSPTPSDWGIIRGMLNRVELHYNTKQKEYVNECK